MRSTRLGRVAGDRERLSNVENPGIPKVKICGVTSPAAAVLCAEAGADWIGLNFHTASPRFVTVERAREILQALPDSVRAVGLFVNHDAREIDEIAQGIGLDLVQIHRDTAPEELARLDRKLQVIQVFRLRDSDSIARMTRFLDDRALADGPPHYALVDAHAEGLPGGTGRLLPEDFARDLPRRVPLILAGGLSPENVAERARLFAPWMVDVASGVESSPGVKDASKVSRFIQNLRASFASAS